MHASRMRVLQVIPAMSASAGAEMSLHAVAPYLLDSGLEIHLAVLTEHQDLAPSLVGMGVAVHDLSGLSGVRMWRRLQSVVRDLEPDLIHASLLQAALPSQVLGRLSGVPVLVTWASTPTDPASSGIPSWKIQVVRVVERAVGALTRTRYHAVTEGVAGAKCRELGVDPERVRVAERGRDPALYVRPPATEAAAVREGLGVEEGDFVFLAVGRQEPAKGYPELLRAFDRVCAVRPEARLLVAGRPGTQSSALEELRGQLQNPERVAFLGHRDDVPMLMACADAVVCSSHREGAAGALIEAMAMSVPIVSVELVGTQGMLVPEVDAVVVGRGELAEGLERAIRDPAAGQRRATSARSTFERRFTTVRSAQQLEAVYRWAVDG